MKIKLGMFLYFLMTIGLFSGCSEKTVELIFSSKEDSMERQKRVDASLRVDTNSLLKNSPDENSRQNSIRSLLSQEGSFKCDWRVEKAEIIEEAEIDNEDEDETGGVEEGVMYMASGKFKQEIKIQENTRENTVDLLSDGEWFYQWNSVTSQGTKIRFNKAEEIGMINFERQYNWSCEPWEEELAKWNLPVNVEFIELTSY